MGILKIVCIADNELELDVNNNLELSVRKQFHTEFEQFYLKPDRLAEPIADLRMDIVVQSKHAAFYLRLRLLYFYETNEVKKIIDYLLEDKIIRKSTSAYYSPIILVKCKDGNLR